MNFKNVYNNLHPLVKKYIVLNSLYFKYYFKFQLKTIWFFTDTLVGYLIFLFLTIYGVTGLSSETNGFIKAWCVIFSMFVAGTTIQWYCMIQIKKVRDFLENFIGKEYIVAHLGEYVGSRAFTKMFMSAFPIIGATGSELGTKAYDAYLNTEMAKEHMRLTQESYDKAGLKMDQKTMEKALQEAHRFRNKPARGIITQGFENDFYKQAIKDTAETLKSFSPYFKK